MFTVGEIQQVQEHMTSKQKPVAHWDIPGVVAAAVQAGVMRDPVAVTWHEGDLLVQLRLNDQVHLSSGWMSTQYVPISFSKRTPDVLLEILAWAHEEAQRLKTAHRLYHEGTRG